jgi:hypothetical protein
VRRATRALLLLVFVGLSLVAATPAPTACPSPAPPALERHPATGLALLGPLPRCAAPPFEPLARAHSDARMLAEAHPDAFGYPWDDRAKRELVISVLSPEGERVARDWIAGGATLPQLGGKSAVLPPPTVAVRFRTVTRSLAELARLEDGIIAFTRTSSTDTSAIHSVGPDDEHDRIVIEVDQLTDALATALAARFGTEAIAIRVDPRSSSSTSLAAQRSDDPQRGTQVALAATAALAAGAAIVVIRRRRRIAP